VQIAGQLERFNRPMCAMRLIGRWIYAQREGLSAVGYIIVGAPDQDPLSSVDDLLFLARRRVLAGVSVFYPAPGSADYERCRELGLLPQSFAGMRATALPIDQRTSRTDSVTLLRLGPDAQFHQVISIAAGVPIPLPAPVDRIVWTSTLDRQQKGLKLLAAFLMGWRHPGTRIRRHGLRSSGFSPICAGAFQQGASGVDAWRSRGRPITTINPKPVSTAPENPVDPTHGICIHAG
jgi:hypothetical protein